MDKYKCKELKEAIDDAYDHLGASIGDQGEENEIQKSIYDIIDALYLLRSEFLLEDER